MTLVSDIILDAYRESNLIAITATITDLEQAEGLRLLQRVVSGAYNSDAGEKFTDFPIGRDNIERPTGWPYYENQPTSQWYVPLNVRILLNIDSAQNIYLSPFPEDGSMFSFIDVANNLATNPVTIYGNGRLIEGETSVLKNTDGDTGVYFYRADTGNWAKLSPLALDDDFPFPVDFDDVFIIALAMRLNPRHDVSTAPESLAAYKKAMNNFQARYAQVISTPPELALLLTPGLRRYRGFWDSQVATDAFLSGNSFLYGGY